MMLPALTRQDVLAAKHFRFGTGYFLFLYPLILPCPPPFLVPARQRYGGFFWWRRAQSVHTSLFSPPQLNTPPPIKNDICLIIDSNVTRIKLFISPFFFFFQNPLVMTVKPLHL